MTTRLTALCVALCAATTPAAALDVQSTTVPGRVPGVGGVGTPLTSGEIAINRADRRLIFRNVDGTLGYGSLLNALPSGRKAVEQGDGSDLSVALSGGRSAVLSALFGDAGRSALFGVTCDGAAGTDNTAAINAMAAALTDAALPPGVCRIKGKLTIPAGHALRAGGRFGTTLAVGPDFDMGAEAVVKLGGKGSRLFDVTLDFAQPDSGVRSQWTRYPTAISALGSGGQWEIDRVRVQRATKTLDMRGEQGQSRIGLLETSFSEMGIDIDGSFDSVHIGTVRFWSYGFTPNQYGVVIDGNTTVNGGLGPIGLNSGRLDGLIVDELFSIFYPKAVRFYYSTGYVGPSAFNGPPANGITTGLINKLQLDTTGGFLCEWCDINVSTAYINIGSPGYTAMIVRGGAVNFGQLNVVTFGTVDFRGQPFPATDVPLIQVDNTSTSPRVTIAGINVETGPHDRTLIQTSASNAANAAPRLNIAAISINKDSGKAYTKPIFDIPVGAGSISGLVLSDLTSGSGTVFNAPNDIPMAVGMPPLTGWTLGVPSGFQQFTVNFGLPGGATAQTLGAAVSGSLAGRGVGILCNGTADDAPAINAALARLAYTSNTAPGSLVLHGPVCAIGQTIAAAKWSSLAFLGRGAGGGGRSGTSLKWIGAPGGVMVNVESAGDGYYTSGLRLDGINLDGNGLAGTGLRVRSMAFSHFGMISVLNTTGIGVDIDVSNNAGVTNGTQQNVFDGFLITQYASAAQGLVLGRGAGVTHENGDVNSNTFGNVSIVTNGGDAFVCGAADANIIQYLRTQGPEGSGTTGGGPTVGLRLKGSSLVAATAGVPASTNAAPDPIGTEACRWNTFQSTQIHGRLVVENGAAIAATPGANTYPARDNYLWGVGTGDSYTLVDRSNGAGSRSLAKGNGADNDFNLIGTDQRDIRGVASLAVTGAGSFGTLTTTGNAGVGGAASVGGFLNVAGAINAAYLLNLTRQASLPPAPGAGRASIVVTPGTNAGTCKVSIVAGTSATPVTLADNVGAGC